MQICTVSLMWCCEFLSFFLHLLNARMCVVYAYTQKNKNSRCIYRCASHRLYVISKTKRIEYNYILIKFFIFFVVIYFCAFMCLFCATSLFLSPISQHINVIKRWYIFDASHMTTAEKMFWFLLFFLRIFKYFFFHWTTSFSADDFLNTFMRKWFCKINVWKILEILYFLLQHKNSAFCSSVCVFILNLICIHICSCVFKCININTRKHFFLSNWADQHQTQEISYIINVNSFTLEYYLSFNEMLVTMEKIHHVTIQARTKTIARD